MKPYEEGTINADVVVIGSGATGLCAALTAAEGGARVVILEKMRYAGGTSNFPEGLVWSGNRYAASELHRCNP